MSINRDEFRRGMLYVLAMNGITPTELGTHLQKQAEFLINPSGFVGAGIKALELPWVAGTAIGAGVGIPGGALAYLATRGNYDQHVSDYRDADAVKELRFRINQIKTRMGGPKRNYTDIQVGG